MGVQNLITLYLVEVHSRFGDEFGLLGSLVRLKRENVRYIMFHHDPESTRSTCTSSKVRCIKCGSS